MIKKLKEHDIIDPKTDKVIGKIGCDLREIMDKLNELVDAVNTIQKEREAERFEIQEWIGILEAVRKSVNVHEKQIDELQMKLEPEKCEIRSENVQLDTKTRSENVQDELERTRKALEIAVDALDRMAIDDNVSGMIARNAIKEIKALEQKDHFANASKRWNKRISDEMGSKQHYFRTNL